MMRSPSGISALILLSVIAPGPIIAQISVPDCSLTLQALSSAEADLSYVTDVAVDSEHRIYVGDRFLHGVAVFREDGSLSHRVGREGDGPGEFRFVRNVSILPGDSLAVFDLQQPRLTVFTPGAAEVAYTLNFAQAAPELVPPSAILLAPERRRIIAQYFGVYRAGQDPSMDLQPRQIVRVLDWNGIPQGDTLLDLPGPQSLVARVGSRVRIGMHPFGLRSPLRLGPDERLYFGRGDSLAIRIYDLTGMQVGEVRREYQPPKITAEDLEWGLDQVSDVLQRVLRDVAPARWPAFRQFVVDDSSRIWIGLDTPRGEPQVWAIMDPSGELLCRARLKDDAEIVLVRGNWVYATVKDEFDVPRIAVFEWQGTR